MEDITLYTADEIALFKSLENDIDNGTYKPLEASKLDEKKRLFEEVADSTLKKMTRKKVTI